MTRRTALSAVITVLLCVVSAGAGAIALNVDGTWSFVLDSADISGSNPGANYAVQRSVTGTIDLDITGATGNWRIDVRKADVDWNPAVPVEVHRTNTGTGTGTAPSGGSAYLEITSVDQQFFTGNLNRANIRIMFQVMPDISLLTVKVYTTTIWFTVTDI